MLRGASPTAAGEAIAHEVMEAFSAAKGDCSGFSACHKKASGFFPEPKGSENSLDKVKGNPEMSTYSEKLTFSKINVSVRITYKITSPVPKDSLKPSTAANISSIEIINKKGKK